MPLRELAERRNLLHRKSDASTLLRHVLTDPKLGRTCLVSSFGADSVVLLHLVAQLNRDLPVLFLDTEMLFPETLRYQRDVAQHLDLTDVRVITPDRTDVLQQDVDGLLHQAFPDACCHLRKVQPLERALAGFDSWITGRKRIQNGQRSTLPLFEKAQSRIKINPLAHWSAQQVQDYMRAHDLPPHPLVADGYPSVGCWPCTTKVSAGEPVRAGRWRGFTKTECGIHSSAAQSPSPQEAKI